MTRLLNYFYYTVMLFSAATTAVGAFTWLSTHVNITAAALVALAGSLMIQLGIGAFYQRFAVTGRSRAPISAAVWLMAALPFSLLSGGFASGANAYLWETATAQQRLDEAIVSEASGPAQIVVARMAEIDRRFRDYEKFSQDEAELEEATGQSCDGLDLPGDCGTICELRKAQAGDASDMAALARQVLGRGETLLGSASGVVTQDAVDRIWKEARALARSTEMDQLRDYVQGERRGFEGAGFETPDGLRQCNDTAAADRLEEIETLLSSPIDLPDIPPTVRDVALAGVATENFAALGTVLNAALFGGAAGPSFAEALQTEAAVFYRKFWAFSLLIELMCAVLGMRYAVIQVPSWPIRRDYGLASAAETLRAEQLYPLYAQLTIRQAGNTYFLEPVHGSMSLGQNAFVFANARKLEKRYGGSTVDLYEFADPEEAARFEAATGTNLARIYRVRKPQAFERELAGLIGYTDLGRSTGPSPAPTKTPPTGPGKHPHPETGPTPADEPRVTQFPGVRVSGAAS
ncbi:MAG: hypothetical protein AAFQ79_01915 [Pseudomonadota bacterium]